LRAISWVSSCNTWPLLIDVDTYSFLLYAHLLLFVSWLGADVGVFGLALTLRNSAYTYDQRKLMMRLSLTIDMVPRMAMIAIAPVGLHLASRNGFVAVPGWLFIAVWAIAIAWMIGEWLAFRRMGQPEAVRFYIVNGIFMAVFCLSLIGFGIASLIGGWPFAPVWLAWKVLISGAIFLTSIMMAVFYAPLEAIFERMAVEGSHDAIEAEVRGQVNKGAFFTVLLFVLLATAAFLGLAKPV
jgi:hypothetical protein